jgi:hypothetical protein
VDFLSTNRLDEAGSARALLRAGRLLDAAIDGERVVGSERSAA